MQFLLAALQFRGALLDHLAEPLRAQPQLAFAPFEDQPEQAQRAPAVARRARAARAPPCLRHIDGQGDRRWPWSPCASRASMRNSCRPSPRLASRCRLSFDQAVSPASRSSTHPVLVGTLVIRRSASRTGVQRCCCARAMQVPVHWLESARACHRPARPTATVATACARSPSAGCRPPRHPRCRSRPVRGRRPASRWHCIRRGAGRRRGGTRWADNHRRRVSAGRRHSPCMPAGCRCRHAPRRTPSAPATSAAPAGSPAGVRPDCRCRCAAGRSCCCRSTARTAAAASRIRRMSYRASRGMPMSWPKKSQRPPRKPAESAVGGRSSTGRCRPAPRCRRATACAIAGAVPVPLVSRPNGRCPGCACWPRRLRHPPAAGSRASFSFFGPGRGNFDETTRLQAQRATTPCTHPERTVAAAIRHPQRRCEWFFREVPPQRHRHAIARLRIVAGHRHRWRPRCARRRPARFHQQPPDAIAAIAQRAHQSPRAGQRRAHRACVGTDPDQRIALRVLARRERADAAALLRDARVAHGPAAIRAQHRQAVAGADPGVVARCPRLGSSSTSATKSLGNGLLPACQRVHAPSCQRASPPPCMPTHNAADRPARACRCRVRISLVRGPGPGMATPGTAVRVAALQPGTERRQPGALRLASAGRLQRQVEASRARPAAAGSDHARHCPSTSSATPPPMANTRSPSAGGKCAQALRAAFVERRAQRRPAAIAQPPDAATVDRHQQAVIGGDQQVQDLPIQHVAGAVLGNHAWRRSGAPVRASCRPRLCPSCLDRNRGDGRVGQAFAGIEHIRGQPAESLQCRRSAVPVVAGDAAANPNGKAAAMPQAAGHRQMQMGWRRAMRLPVVSGDSSKTRVNGNRCRMHISC